MTLNRSSNQVWCTYIFIYKKELSIKLIISFFYTQIEPLEHLRSQFLWKCTKHFPELVFECQIERTNDVLEQKLNVLGRLVEKTNRITEKDKRCECSLWVECDCLA